MSKYRIIRKDNVYYPQQLSANDVWEYFYVIHKDVKHAVNYYDIQGADRYIFNKINPDAGKFEVVKEYN